jgi:hypothetical protein
MANTTITSQDKIKLLDQMLEDLAGDEFEDNLANEANINSGLKSFANNHHLSDIENLH